MRVFISWSGERSNQLALALYEWLPLVLHYVKPWLSKTDIQAGDRWTQSVAQELTTSNFGIVCVTPENANAPWLLFESGALAKSLEIGKVIPLLYELEFAEFSGPLTQFQAKKLTQEGLDEIVQSLQSSAEEPVPEARARHLFEALWPELEKKLVEIPKKAPKERHVRPQTEVLEELVTSVRALDARVQQSDQSIQRISSQRNARRSYILRPDALQYATDSLASSPGDPILFLIIGSAFRDRDPAKSFMRSEAAVASAAGRGRGGG